MSKKIIGFLFSDCLDKMATVKCSEHSMDAEYYCKDHNTVTCRDCSLFEHGACDNKYIPSYCGGVNIRQDVRETAGQLVKLQETAEETKRKKQIILGKYQSELEERKESMKSLRREFNTLFDRYDAQLESQGASVISGVSSCLNTCTGISDQLKEHIKSMEDDTVKLDKHTLLQKLICATDIGKMFKSQLDEMQGNKIKCDTVIMEAHNQKSLFGQLSSLVQPEVTDSEEVVEEVSKQKPTPNTFFRKKKEDNIMERSTNMSFQDISNCSEITEIDVRVRGDAYTPCITGCCYLSDGQVILCDNYNKAVKILDQDMNIKVTAPCSSAPWDVDCIDDNSLVMTLPAAKSLQYISIKPGFKFKDTKKLNLQCFGIGVKNNKIFVCIDNWSVKGVKILTLKGDDLSFITHLGAGAPRYLCVSNNDRIYYSGNSGTFYAGNPGYRPFVNCVTKDGHGIFSITSPNFNHPNSVVPDENGNILVSDKKGIHVISSEGVYGRKLLEEKNTYEERSICYNRQTNCLIVTRNNCGLLRLYSSTIVLLKLNFINDFDKECKTSKMVRAMPQIQTTKAEKMSSVQN